MADSVFHDDKLWAVEKYSERRKRWVRVARTVTNPSGLRTYAAAVKISDERSDKYPKQGYRVHLIVTNPFHVIEGHYELERTSGDNDAPGAHAPGSYHYVDAPWGGVEAYDYGTSKNAPIKLKAAASHIRAGVPIGAKVPRYRDRFVAELFGPFKWHIKDGIVRGGQFPDHEDHLHLALKP